MDTKHDSVLRSVVSRGLLAPLSRIRANGKLGFGCRTGSGKLTNCQVWNKSVGLFISKGVRPNLPSFALFVRLAHPNRGSIGPGRRCAIQAPCGVIRPFCETFDLSGGHGTENGGSGKASSIASRTTGAEYIRRHAHRTFASAAEILQSRWLISLAWRNPSCPRI